MGSVVAVLQQMITRVNNLRVAIMLGICQSLTAFPKFVVSSEVFVSHVWFGFVWADKFFLNTQAAANKLQNP